MFEAVLVLVLFCFVGVFFWWALFGVVVVECFAEMLLKVTA